MYDKHQWQLWKLLGGQLGVSVVLGAREPEDLSEASFAQHTHCSDQSAPL